MSSFNFKMSIRTTFEGEYNASAYILGNFCAEHTGKTQGEAIAGCLRKVAETVEKVGPRSNMDPFDPGI